MASARGDRTVYRDRDDDDAPRRSYTTIKRYQVPENVTRAVYQDDSEVVDKKIVIRRTRAASPQSSQSGRTQRRQQPSTEETDWRVTERVVEREVSREPPPRRDIRYRVVERDNDDRSEYRTVVRKREIVRAPSPPSSPSPERERIREYRFERERDFSPPRERAYDVEKYSKSTEYFAQPQPIIIREPAPAAPIIIREERREPQRIIIRREEPQYEFVERREVVETRDESQSLVKKEESPEPEPEPAPEPAKPEEDYFYERRIIERRRRSDSYDRKSEIRPRDSASQYSDESYEYVRRERYETSRSRSGSRSRSRARTLATGALAGAGAAAILGNHKKKQGEETHQGRNVIAGAALGAAASEGISRYRSSTRHGSRSRSRSNDRDRGRDEGRRRRKHRSRSRSKSRDLTRAQKLGGLAAVAAVGALAGYALKKSGNKETIIVNDPPPRRSRSRRRRSSYDSSLPGERPGSEHRNPDHRNMRMAQAGLASAAAAGIWERVRSRSRPAGSRSKSNVAKGVPIAAAGLGGAALAGLYEKNKANKEAKKDAIIEDELGRGRRRPSRSLSRRSRSRRAPKDDDRSRDEPGLIAYGHDPILPDHRRGRNYYSDEEPGRYRRRGGSGSSSPDNRNRSRVRDFAAGGAAVGGAGLAAYELNKRRERSRSKVANDNRRRDDDDQGYYDDRRHPDDPYSPPPMGGNNGYPPYDAPYGGQPSAYPTSHYFPPPPTDEVADRNDPYGAPADGPTYLNYNPADYAGQPAQQQPHDDHAPYNPAGGYGEHIDTKVNQPYPNDDYAGDQRYAEEPYFPRREHGSGRSPDNVSEPDFTRRPPSTDVANVPRGAENMSPAARATNDESEDDGRRRRRRSSADGDGLTRTSSSSTPRPRSSSRVRFDLNSNIAHSPDSNRRKDDAKRSNPASGPDSRGATRDDDGDDDDSSNNRDRPTERNKLRKRRREPRSRRGEDERGGQPRHSRRSSRDRDAASDSEGTIDLPPRFDERGNPKPEDPLAAKINELLNAQGGAGGIFKSLAQGLMGGGRDDGSEEGSGGGGRRRRRSGRD